MRRWGAASFFCCLCALGAHGFSAAPAGLLLPAVSGTVPAAVTRPRTLHIFIINSRTRLDRLTRLAARLSNVHMPSHWEMDIHRIDAVEPEDTDPAHLYPHWRTPDIQAAWGDTRGRWSQEVTKTEAAGFSSHMRAVQAISQVQGEPGRESLFAVLEDDVTFDNRVFFNAMDKYVTELSAIDPAWDYFSPALTQLDHKSEGASKNLMRPGYFYESHAYLLSLTGARKLAQHGVQNVIPFDEFLSAAARRHPRAELNDLYFDSASVLRVYTGLLSSDIMAESQLPVRLAWRITDEFVRGSEAPLTRASETEKAAELRATVDAIVNGTGFNLPATAAIASQVGYSADAFATTMRSSVWLFGAGSTKANGLYILNGTCGTTANYAMVRDGLHFEMFMNPKQNQWQVQQVLSTDPKTNWGVAYGPVLYRAHPGNSAVPPSTGWRVCLKATSPPPLGISSSYHPEAVFTGWNDRGKTTYVSVKFDGADRGRAMFKYASALGIARTRGSTLLLADHPTGFNDFEGPFASLKPNDLSQKGGVELFLTDIDLASCNRDMMLGHLYAEHVEVGQHLMCPEFFADIKDELRTTFTPVQAWREAADGWLRDHGLRDETRTCIHISRGSGNAHEKWQELRMPSVAWYAKNMAEFADSSKFIVFTDDTKWAHEQKLFQGDDVIISGAENGLMLDWALLNQCDNYLLSRGAFGWWAAFASPHLQSLQILFSYAKRY